MHISYLPTVSFFLKFLLLTQLITGWREGLGMMLVHMRTSICMQALSEFSMKDSVLQLI